MSDNVEKPLSYQSTRKRARTLGLCEKLVFISVVNFLCYFVLPQNCCKVPDCSAAKKGKQSRTISRR